MRIFMRILLTLYLLFFIAIAGVVLCCAFGLISMDYPSWWLKLVYTDLSVRWLVSFIAVIIIIVSFVLMFSGIRRRKPRAALVRMTEGGAISISISALEEMVTRYIAANEAVRTVRATATVRDSRLNVQANLSVAEGTNIPETLQAIQTGLKSHVETLSGIEVNKIMLLVEKTTQVVKARVE